MGSHIATTKDSTPLEVAVHCNDPLKLRHWHTLSLQICSCIGTSFAKSVMIWPETLLQDEELSDILDSAWTGQASPDKGSVTARQKTSPRMPVSTNARVSYSILNVYN